MEYSSDGLKWGVTFPGPGGYYKGLAVRMCDPQHVGFYYFRFDTDSDTGISAFGSFYPTLIGDDPNGLRYEWACEDALYTPKELKPLIAKEIERRVLASGISLV